MQAVATATLAAVECPPVDLVDPAVSPSTPGCRLTSAAEDQNSNVVVELETNHNHHHQDADGLDDSVTPPSTLTLRLIMQGKVRLTHSLH